MGNSYPHFNVTSLSYIVCTRGVDLYNIISTYKMTFPENEEMKLSKEAFNEILIQVGIHESGFSLIFDDSTHNILDQALFLKFYTLLDVSGFENVPILVESIIFFL